MPGILASVALHAVSDLESGWSSWVCFFVSTLRVLSEVARLLQAEPCNSEFEAAVVEPRPGQVGEDFILGLASKPRALYRSSSDDTMVA